MKLKLLLREWWHYVAGQEEHGHRGKKVEVLDSSSTLSSLARILEADNPLGHPLCSHAPLCEVHRSIAVYQVKIMSINSNSIYLVITNSCSLTILGYGTLPNEYISQRSIPNDHMSDLFENF